MTQETIRAKATEIAHSLLEHINEQLGIGVPFVESLLKDFHNEVRNETIEETAMHLEKYVSYNVPPEADETKVQLAGHIINRVRSLKSKRQTQNLSTKNSARSGR